MNGTKTNARYTVQESILSLGQTYRRLTGQDLQIPTGDAPWCVYQAIAKAYEMIPTPGAITMTKAAVGTSPAPKPATPALAPSKQERIDALRKRINASTDSREKFNLSTQIRELLAK